MNFTLSFAPTKSPIDEVAFVGYLTNDEQMAPALLQLRQRLARLPTVARGGGGTFVTGVGAVDELLPASGLSRGAVHEVLAAEPTAGGALAFALLLMRGATDATATNALEAGHIAWCDPQRELYPFGLRDRGVDLSRLVLLRPRGRADEVWAVAEALRCRGVAVVVAAPPALSRVEARRLQLAAERGGGVGLFLRPTNKSAGHYAAATRWRVEPAPGDEASRRFYVSLIHGHGGRVHNSVLLEVCRETNCVRATDELAHRSPAQAPAVPIVATPILPQRRPA